MLVQGREDGLRDPQELALGPQLAFQRTGLLAQQECGVGVGHGLGREGGVDDQQPQVVLGELAQALPREHDDAEAGALVDHRREEQRLVLLSVRAGDRDAARVAGAVVHELRHLELGDPAGDPLADRHRQHLGCLRPIDEAVALERDRDELAAVHPVHAGVVVGDELAELGGDGVADVVHVRDACEAGTQALDRLELGRPGGHPAERARGSHGDRRVARERLGGVEVTLAPAVGAVVGQVEDAMERLAVDEGDPHEALDALLDGGRSDRAG